MITRLAAITALLLMASASLANAQARTVVTPSMSVGFVYDDNVFYEQVGNLEAIWRVTPGLRVTRETARTALFADLSFDAERFRENESLSTPLARQSGLLRVRHQATPRAAFGFEGGIESTRAPAELNLTTGLLTGRRRAIRVYGGPSIEGDVSERLKATFDYTLNGDIVPEGSLLIADATVSGDSDELVAIQAPASRLWTHLLTGRLGYEVTPRHEFRVTYVGRWFVFAEPTRLIVNPPGTTPLPGVVAPSPNVPDPIVRHTALVGWAYRINPATRLELAVGPRFRFGSTIADSGSVVEDFEIEALVSRQRVTHDVFLSYVRTVTTAVGVTSLIEVDRGFLRGVYHAPFAVQPFGELGYYRSAIDDQDITVLHVNGGLTVPLGGPVALGFSYGVDLQYGRFGLNPDLPPIGVPGPEIDPRRFRDPNAPMRKGVALIQLVISPSTRPTSEDPPPGAAPVRHPPIKKSGDR